MAQRLVIYCNCIGCLPLSQHTGRCGPNWGGRCNKNLGSDAVYCNVDNGWCGVTDAHKNAQPSDTYDWAPASCQGNRFHHTIPHFTYHLRLIT